MERDGLSVSFRGWCYPLAAYTEALEAAGFVLEALREPVPALDAPPRMERYRRIPMFLMLRALKPARSPERVSELPPRRSEPKKDARGSR